MIQKVFKVLFWYVLIPPMAICEFYLISNVRLLTGAILLGVWSRFMIIECGTAYFLTKFATCCCYSNFASHLASSGISGFEVVVARLQNPIFLKKLLAHVADSRSNNLRCSSLLLAINAFEVASATTVFKKPPFCLQLQQQGFAFSSSVATNSTGLPRFKRDILLGVVFSCLVIFLYQSLNFHAVLSPKFRRGWFFLNRFTVFVAPLTAVYLPVSKHSSSVNCTVFFVGPFSFKAAITSEYSNYTETVPFVYRKVTWRSLRCS